MDDQKKLEKEFNQIKKATFLKLQQLGVPNDELELDFGDYNVAKFNLRALLDFVWSQFNKHILRQESNFDAQSRTYFEMAIFRFKYENGKGVFELKKQSVEAKKQSYELMLNHNHALDMNVVIITAKDSCAVCMNDQGRCIALKDFLHMNILPHENCTCEGFGCTCSFGVKANRDAEENLIWKDLDTKHEFSKKKQSLQTKSTTSTLLNEGAKTF
ncbi:MAG: hypothetical protein K0M56_03005 [Kaistella sp.]|nr:hypothetical protein [Kaistella sp.]